MRFAPAHALLLALLALSAAAPSFANADEAPSAAARRHAPALRSNPESTGDLLGLGRALLGLNRPADAIPVFRRLESLRPDDPDAPLGIAAASAVLPDPLRPDVLRGLESASRAVVLLPDSPEAWRILSVLRHLDGQYEAAADAASRALILAVRQRRPPAEIVHYQQQETACNQAVLVFSPLD